MAQIPKDINILLQIEGRTTTDIIRGWEETELCHKIKSNLVTQWQRGWLAPTALILERCIFCAKVHFTLYSKFALRSNHTLKQQLDTWNTFVAGISDSFLSVSDWAVSQDNILNSEIAKHQFWAVIVMERDYHQHLETIRAFGDQKRLSRAIRKVGEISFTTMVKHHCGATVSLMEKYVSAE